MKKAIEGKVDTNIPASFLQNHKNVTFVLDRTSASNLTRIRSPWKVGSCIWTKELKSKAVVWLCKNTNKSILNLTESDYNENNLSELLIHQSPYDINLEVFNKKREKYCSAEVKKNLFDPFLTKIYNTQNGIQTLMQFYKKA